MEIPIWLVAAGMPMLLTITLAVGLPVAFSLALVATISILTVWGPSGLPIIASGSYASVTTFILVAVPLFLLIGENLIHSGITENAFDMMYKWLGWLPGGLAITTIATAAVFGAISGFAPAVCTIMGKAALPEMLKHGYSKRLSAGCILGGAALDILIPPSSLMVILGFLAGVSIGKMFFSGLVIGVMIMLMFIAYILLRALLQPGWAPPVKESPPLRERLATLKYALPLMGVIFLILGTIFFGIATPTESAALGFWGTLILAMCYGKFKVKDMKRTLSMTAQYTAMLFMIVIGATLFSRCVSYVGIAPALVSWIESLKLSPWWVMIAMQLMIMIMGSFMDAGSICFITIPFFMPVVKALHIDALWFCSIMMVNLELGTIHPPLGLNLFVLKGVSPPEVTMADIIMGGLPFVGIHILGMVLVMIFPQIALWLPNQMVVG
jgi:tripartite ATP-independent transporter DctM subunit